MQREPDNLMLTGLEREDRRLTRAAALEDQAALMLKNEFLTALMNPLLRISTPGYGPTEQTQALVDVVIDLSLFKGQLLADLLHAAAACDDPAVLAALREFAVSHSENHVSLMAAEGAFRED
jgi:hypothetical protein